MAINPPKEIADFLGFVSGMEWPQADEDLMRRVSEHYASIAKDLKTLSGYVVELIPIVKGDFDGEAADAFLVAMNDLTGQTAGENQLEQTAELARQLSEVALKVANQVEYTKIMAILQLVELLAQIMFATIFSPFTFGAVWGPVSVMFTATREGLKNLFMWLLSTILSQTFIGITGGIFRDAIIQIHQLSTGHTTSWNTESMIDSIKQGALTGLVGGPLEVVFHYGGKLLGRLLGGSDPGSILSRRVDDALRNKADDKIDDTLDNSVRNTAEDTAKGIPDAGPGAGAKVTDKPDLPPNTPRNEVPDGTPAPVRTEAPGDVVTTPPAARPDAPAPVKAQAPAVPTKAVGSGTEGLGSLLATKKAQQEFAKDVGNLLGGVSRQLETGFLRFGAGTIAGSFADKMGEVFVKHLAAEGADAALKAEIRAAGHDFAEMLTRKWVRLGADHSDLSESLTKALGNLGHVQPLKNLADAMPDVFNRSEHKGFFQRVLFQENPLQGNPLYQLGGALGQTLNEGTHEMLSEGFYNVVFGDGTFTVSGGPFASGVVMSLLGSGLHRMFEPIAIKYQNWVLSHQHADNPGDSKYFGLFHPINIVSFVSNMTGNPAPWPVPRPTSQAPDPSVTAEMKAMIKWVFSNPFTGNSFFSDAPHRTDVPTADALDDVIDVATESDSGNRFGLPEVTPDRPFGEEFADHPLFRTDEVLTRPAFMPTESGSNPFTTDGPGQQPGDGTATAPGGPVLRPGPELTAGVVTPTVTHTPLTAVVESASPTPGTTGADIGTGGSVTDGVDTTVAADDSDTSAAAPTAGDHTSLHDDSSATTPEQPDGPPPGDGDGDGDDMPPHGPDTPALVIDAGIAVGELSPAQVAALQALPPRPGVFVVGMHTGPAGAPDPATTLKALIKANDDGALDGITRIQFTACSLAAPISEATVKTVMSGLWKHRAGPTDQTGPSTPDTLTALAANAPVWYIPTTDTSNDTTTGHLVTAHHIGITPDGRPTILTNGAAWHEYTDTGDTHHTPAHTNTHPNDLPDHPHTPIPTTETGAPHPHAVKFGDDPDEDGPLSRVLPEESWAMLLDSPDDRMITLLGKVLNGRDSAWRTLDPDSYLRLRALIERKETSETPDDVLGSLEEAFSYYEDSVTPDTGDQMRLEAIAETVQLLQCVDGLPPSVVADVRIVAQRLLLDHGYLPALLPDEGYSSEHWQDSKGEGLSYQLALGMAAFVRRTGWRPQGADAAGGPLSRALPKEAWPRLLDSPDDRMTTLLGQVLNGEHRSGGDDWRTVNADTYLTLRARIDGTEPAAEALEGVRRKVDALFDTYHRSVDRASGEQQRLQAVAQLVKDLQKVEGLTASSESGYTADVRFLAQRLLLDQGYLPSLAEDAGTAKFWRRSTARVAEELAMGMARVIRLANEPSSPSSGLTTASGDGAGPTATPALLSTDDRSVSTDDRPVSTDHRPVSTDDRSGSGTSEPVEPEVPDPDDWRAELDGLGTRTDGVTTAYLVLPSAAHQVAGRSDAFLRTGDKPWATLTTEPASHDGRTLLEVSIPEGHAVDVGDGRLLVGKDSLTGVTVSRVVTGSGGLQPWHAQTEADLVGQPLTVLTRLGQALQANPGKDANSPVARLALRMTYAEASREAERPLGEYIAGNQAVQRQVQRLVQAIWDRADEAQRRSLGYDENSGSGSVGKNLADLQQVVTEGHIREQMYMLGAAVHGDVLKQLLSFKKATPQILDQEWKQQHPAEPTQRRDALQGKLDGMAAGADRDALAAELKPMTWTELRPDDVVPPLSPRERRHALDEGRLTWVPGENHRAVKMVSWGQALAQVSGGLMSAGTSNTTYFMLEAIRLMEKRWGVEVDYQLVRLALMADMLPVHHHSFHEIMRAADAFGRDVLKKDTLDYVDNWSRFRSLPPLTESELRSVMPGGRFPDEIALGLEAHERVPDSVGVLRQDQNPRLTGRRLSQMLPPDSWPMLLKDGADPEGRLTPLIREVLDRQPSPTRDWRRLNADSYLELRRRIEGAEPPAEPDGPEPWLPDEDEPEPDTVREGLDAIFDRYYENVAQASGDPQRLAAVADVVQQLQQFEALQPWSSETGITAHVRILAQRFLLDQGHTPALLPDAGHTREFWQRSADQIAADLVTGMEAFARLRPVRDEYTDTERVDEIAEAITRSRQENGTHHIVDPGTDTAEAVKLRDTVGRFPRDDRFFTLAGHIVATDGAPTWRGRRVSPAELAAVLYRLAGNGVWDTAKPLQFAACDLGRGLEGSYAANTLRELRRLLPELPLTAFAPQSTLWFVPKVTGPFTTDPTGPGHTVAAHKVGWDASGRPRLAPDHWVRLSLPVGEGAVVEATVLDAHMPPDGTLPADAVPTTVSAPDGYLASRLAGTGPLPDAVPFGENGNGEGPSNRPAPPGNGEGPSSQPTPPGNGEGSSSQPAPVAAPQATAAPTADAPDPTPQVPWYVADGALGDGYVTSVHAWADADKQQWLATTERSLGERGLGAKTVTKIMSWLGPTVTGDDPKAWQQFLQNGLVFRAEGKRVTLTAWPENLRHHGPQPKEELAGFASRNQPVSNRTVASGSNSSAGATVDFAVKLVDAGALTGVIPSVKLTAGTTTGASRTATVDTQGAGRTVVKEMIEFDGDVDVTVRVEGRDPFTFRAADRLRMAFPEASVPADGTAWTGPRPVVNPNGLKAVLSTVNAVAPRQVVADLAGHLAAAKVAPEVAAKFLNEVTEDLLNEKTLKDSNQWWTSGSWTSKVFTADGRPGSRSLAGHFQVGARLTSLERKGDTRGELRVREDFSDSFGVKSSSRHSGKAGITVTTSALVSLSPYVLVPSVDLAVNTARAHNLDAGGSDKTKQKLKFASETQADYRAEADFRVEFTSLSKHPIPPFESRLVLAVGVPASQASRFEELVLGPSDAAGPMPPAPPPNPADAGGQAPAPAPASRFRAATLAVRSLLRMARQEPAANFDVGVQRPFPSGGMPSALGLLKIARRQPIEVAVPQGRIPHGDAWNRLRERPEVTFVDDRDSYSFTAPRPGPGTPEPVFRYFADGQGTVTAAQRLVATGFTGLFGPLNKAHEGGITELTAFLGSHPEVSLVVLEDPQFTLDHPEAAGDLQDLAGHPQVSPHARGGPHRTTMATAITADGTIEVPGTLRHPVEQATLNLAAATVRTPPHFSRSHEPPRIQGRGLAELEDFATRYGPVELQISPQYAQAQQLAEMFRQDDRVRLLDATGTREAPYPPESSTAPARPEPPATYLMVVDKDGALLGPFPRREFPVDPREPLSLASRKGLGPGLVGELPGAEKVLPAARDWLDAHLTAAGLKKQLDEEHYGRFQRDLAAAFGTPGMRARFGKLTGSGVPVTLQAGDHEIRLHLRTELKELRGTSEEGDVSLGRSAQRSTNYGVGQGDQVSFSVSGGTTLRVGTGGGVRVEVPGVKVTGGASLSNVKESVSSTVKSSHGEESTGTHTAFTYAAVHHLTATVHDGNGNLVSGTSLEFGGDDTSAVVRVSNEHLATAPHDPAQLMTVGTTTVFDGPDEPGWVGDGQGQSTEFALPASGLGGVHTEFLGTKELSAATAAFVARRGGSTPPPTGLDTAFGELSGDAVGALRQGLTPEIEEIFTPNFLQSEFEQLTGPDGAVFPLPPKPGGHPQALVVKLKLAGPAYETSGTGTSLSHSTETGTKAGTADTSSRSIGGTFSGGFHARLTADSRGASLAASGSVEGTRTFTDGSTRVSNSTVSSTLTYKGTSHRFRADAYFEITHHTWAPPGKSTAVSDTATLYAKVTGGVELAVADRQARDLGLPLPAAAGPGPDAGPHPERSYVNDHLANAVSHVEKLDADQVLPAIRRTLHDLKVIPDALRTTPTDLDRSLAAVFSPESLRANFANLRTTSVRQLLKLRAPGGGTRLIGIRATAEVGGATYVRPRGDVVMAVGDSATTSSGTSSGTSDKIGWQAGVAVKGGSPAGGGPRGGVKFGGGAETTSGRTATGTAHVKDQHGLEITGEAHEFSHPVRYKVDVFDAGEPHQLVRLAGAALTAPAQLIDWATDGRAGRWFSQEWGSEWDTLFPSGHEPKRQLDVPGGQVRLLVPDHLTWEGPGTRTGAVPVAGRVRPDGPAPVPEPVRKLTEDLAPAMQALAMPGLDRVLPWLSAAASLPHRVAAQDTTPPQRRDLAPTTLAGLRTDVLTTERNLRANIGALLGAGYPVPVAGGRTVTVRLVVHRARHLTAAEFDTGVETGVTEREKEREREEGSGAWSGSVTPDFGSGPANAHAPVSFGGERGGNGSTSQGETVDEREKKKGVQHYYEADVTWVLTGSDGTTAEVKADGGLIGLMHESFVDKLAETHRGLFAPKPAPVPTIEVTSPDGEDGPQQPPQPQPQPQPHEAPEPPTAPARPVVPVVPVVPYEVTRYERGGTTAPGFREQQARIEVSEDVDQYELVLNGGLPKDAASFPLYRPVRPVHTVDRPTLTVSGDSGFALPRHDGRSRQFYATPEAVRQARAALAAAGGTFALTVDDTSYVRFGGTGTEHTLHRVTVEGSGSGASGPVVLAGDPQGHHLTLRHDSRARQREADMREAVEANLRHYGDQLPKLVQQLQQQEPDSGRTQLARAMADLHRARTDLAAPDGGPAEHARLEQAEAAALAAALRALAACAGDEYGTADEDWYVHLGPGAFLTLPTVDWSA
ncbi:WXG100-like domain-containing protein [Streptomyces bambusae]|uniref:Outer membrane channel protein CpnT-like N-terminal domain-containing protein n=1 Tax=Streptomyces bambusae TaxID=1550616 RepID=A0ABS6Z8T3_9ACTN|nr:hypothetical protein [Streptomyces bambusae]MBW5483110.1 hypothetical protein [Streptomyces bambusae]